MCPTSAVYLPNRRLSSSELRSAALDGELVAVGEGFVPIDAPHTAHIRACSLSPLVIDARVIIAGRSAAWVWGWGEMPLAVTTCVSIAARIPSPDRRRLRAREVVIHEGEWIMLGDVAVTSPVRTLVDLARHDSGPDLAALLERGIRTHRIEPRQFDEALTGRTNLSFVRMARKSLDEASRAASTLDRAPGVGGVSQPLLTRYTS